MSDGTHSRQRLFNTAAEHPVSYDVLAHVLPDAIKAQRQKQYREYYDHKIEQIRTYFRLKNYDVPEAALNVLLKYKQEKGSWRKDGYTPPEGHEIDLLLSRIGAVESGAIDVEAAEAEYGPIEQMFISILVHDLGEDYGWMPEDLKAELTEAMGVSSDQLNSHQQFLIDQGAKRMERLTHDRHYLLDEFIEKFGQEYIAEVGHGLDIRIPSLPREAIGLNDSIKGFLWSKMDILDDSDPSKFQAFIQIDKKNRPKITVTRHGKQNEWGASWDSYIDCAEQDPYDAANKDADSVSGMTSRLMIESFTREGYRNYLDQREVTFSLNGLIAKTAKKFPSLANDIRSLGGMMGVAYTLGKEFVMYYPRPDRVNESSFCVFSRRMDKDGVPSIAPYDYFERAFASFKLTPGLSHPIGRMMQQYRDVVEVYKDHPKGPDMTKLYEQSRAILIKHGKKYCPDIEMLIDNPEKYDPMPSILMDLTKPAASPDCQVPPLPN